MEAEEESESALEEEAEGVEAPMRSGQHAFVSFVFFWWGEGDQGALLRPVTSTIYFEGH